MGENEKTRVDYEYEDEILELLRSNLSPKIISDKLKEYHANDLANVLPKLTDHERESLYRMVSIEELAEIFSYCDEPDKYLDELDLVRAASVLEEMEEDDAVDILKNTESPNKKAWIALMSESSQKSIAMLASYDEDEIASRMTTNFVTLPYNISIKEAVSSVIAQAAENDNISVIYVLDEKGVFYGAIDLKDLIIARSTDKLEDLIVTAYPYVYAHEKIDDCLEKLKEYSEESIPVLSDDNHILGVITAQDITEVLDAEMGEDYAKFAGLSAEEDLKEPLGESIKKRLPWLILLLGLGLIVSSVVSVFEGVVAKLTLIMAFQSLILDMSGNVGTQSLAVTIRVLTNEKLTLSEKFKLIWKEMRVGFVNGLALCLISFVGIGIYIMAVKHYGPGMAFTISGCVGISLALAMTISSFVGTSIPEFFKSVGIDPAAASGPLITTVTDLVGVVTYYGLSWLLLINTLHLV